MSAPKQRTLANEVSLEGAGVHSGETARLTLRPAAEGSGVVFRRMDLEGAPEVRASYERVVGTQLGTTIGEGETRIATIEHLMAALYAAGVDNAVAEVDGPEVPILDGSFLPFAEAIAEAGTEEQEADARLMELPSAVATDGKNGETYMAAPSDALSLTVAIDFDHPAIGHQLAAFPITPERFLADLAPARTFGFQADAEALREKGLALGASLDNSIVLTEEGVLNDDLRFQDEFVRHKAGDLLGDLALLGGRLSARISAERPSHRGNAAFTTAIAEHVRRGHRKAVADIGRIMEFLPHRYPFLLVDRIIDYEPGHRIVGIKNVTINEPFFPGHYPGHPVMPGVLIIEAMAQVGGLLLMEAVENPDDKVVYFMSLDRVKWRKPVMPGDTLVFELELIQFRRQICRMQGKAFVDGVLVAEGELMARIMDK